MIDVLDGYLLGGAFRLAPELLRWFDRQAERGYHLALLDRPQRDLPELRPPSRPPRTIYHARIEALSSVMRPLITFWWVVVLYTAALVAQYIALLAAGAGQLEAVLKLWGPDEKAIVAGIVNYWFMDRSLQKDTRP